jgi:hypothetical protein
VNEDRMDLLMANNWNIPDWLEKEVRERDKNCVYCRVEFTPSKISKKTAASWEHIINDAKIITRENISLCCCGCNASKGQKSLSNWLQSKYCKYRGIDLNTVAPIIKQAIANGQ